MVEGHYHFHMQIIGRGGGGSSLKAAAYRSGGVLRETTATEAAAYRSGGTVAVHDYSRHAWTVAESLILLPSGAPEWMGDRQRLWAAVEERENRSTRPHDAQLARDFDIALPASMTDGERRALLLDYVGGEFVRRGMVADISFHRPHPGSGSVNHHAHVMLTMRHVTPYGFGNKAREWNDEFRKAKDGTPLAQANALKRHREKWTEYANRHLEAAGLPERIDHRSYADRGIDKLPQQHKGKHATAMERKGRASYIASDNAKIAARNAAMERTMDGDWLKNFRAQIEASELNPYLSAALNDFAETVASGKERLDQAHTLCMDQSTAQERDEAKRLADMKRASEAAQFDGGEATTRQQTFDLYLEGKEEEAKKGKARVDAQEGDRRGDPMSWPDDAEARYLAALGRTYNINNPYETLARAALIEGAEFRAGQHQLYRAIQQEPDQDRRGMLYDRYRIQQADYMALTSTRISGIDQALGSKEIAASRANAGYWKAMSTELRRDWNEKAVERPELYTPLDKATRDRADQRAGEMRVAPEPSGPRPGPRAPGAYREPAPTRPTASAKAQQGTSGVGIAEKRTAEQRPPMPKDRRGKLDEKLRQGLEKDGVTEERRAFISRIAEEGRTSIENAQQIGKAIDRGRGGRS